MHFRYGRDMQDNTPETVKRAVTGSSCIAVRVVSCYGTERWTFMCKRVVWKSLFICPMILRSVSGTVGGYPPACTGKFCAGWLPGARLDHGGSQAAAGV